MWSLLFKMLTFLQCSVFRSNSHLFAALQKQKCSRFPKTWPCSQARQCPQIHSVTSQTLFSIQLHIRPKIPYLLQYCTTMNFRDEKKPRKLDAKKKAKWQGSFLRHIHFLPFELKLKLKLFSSSWSWSSLLDLAWFLYGFYSFRPFVARVRLISVTSPRSI